MSNIADKKHQVWLKSLNNSSNDVDQLVEKITKAISFKYKEDKTVPGLTVAYLKNGFYCSIIRYNGAFAKDKLVVCHARAATLELCLKDLSETFLALPSSLKDPVQELKDFLKVSKSSTDQKDDSVNIEKLIIDSRKRLLKNDAF